MSLKNAVAVVTGATGVVSGGIVNRLLQEGATVVAPLRSEASKPKLTDHLTSGTELLHMPVADWGTEAGAAALAQFVTSKGLTVDHVVSVAGGMAPPGDVKDITPALLQEAVQSKLLGHVLLAQHLLPLVRAAPTSSWTVITGMLGQVCIIPGAALTCVANSATFGLVKALQYDHSKSPVRINELRIGAIIKRDGEAGNPVWDGVPTFPPSKIGGLLLSIASGQQSDEVIIAPAEVIEKY